MTQQEAAAKQAAYVESRRVHREVWWAEQIEDFCTVKEIDPANGRPLFDYPELR